MTTGFTLELDGDPDEIELVLVSIYNGMARAERLAERKRRNDPVGLDVASSLRQTAVRASSLHGQIAYRNPVDSADDLLRAEDRRRHP